MPTSSLRNFFRKTNGSNPSPSLFTLKRAVCVLAAMSSLAALSFAQSTVTGEISGIVLDPTEAAVVNANVSAKSSDTGQVATAVTNAQGQFRLALLRPGQYVITVAAKGFQDTTQTAMASLGQVSTLTLRMGIQQSTQSVTVVEAGNALQVEDANLTTTFNQTQLENLPAPGNDMTAYALTAPGVTVSTGGGYGNFSVFGLPGVSNLFTINGSDNMDPYLNLNNSGASNLTLGANEIQEAAVVVNGYTGQYGRQAGAQVNYVTKSGSNAFHGNAGFWYNEKVLNANDWFNNQSGTDRPFAISRQWADSIGGPIKKNKLFFFFNNEGLRYVLPGGGATYIPTADFSTYVLNNIKATNPGAVPLYTTALNLYSGASGASRATNVPVTADDPGGCGDFTGGGFGVSQTLRPHLPQHRQQPQYRVADGWPRGLRSLRFRPHLLPLQPGQGRSGHQYRSHQSRVQREQRSALLRRSVRLHQIHRCHHGEPVAALGHVLLGHLRTSEPFGGSLAAFPTTFTFGDGDYNNVGGSDNSYPQGRNVGQWQIIDDFSLVRGRHEIKVGMNFRRNYVSSFAYGPNTSGLVTFNSMTDFVNGSLDNGSTYSQAFTRIGGEFLSLYSGGVYGQDTWRASSKATITMALRLDRNSNITCRLKCFNQLGAPFASVNHDPTQPYNSVIKTGLKEAFPSIEPIVAAPRVGVAYSITPTTVLRGGVGLFSDLYQGLIADRFLTNAPNVASFIANSGTVAPGATGSAFAAVANSYNAFQKGFAGGATLAQLQASVPLGYNPPNYNTIANKIYNPKYIEWNVELQQSFAKNYVVSVNYVGNHGYDEFNQTLLGNAFSTKNFATLPTAAPDKRFAEVRELNNAGYSNYDGLVSSFRWRMGSQFQGAFNYTFSHSLDTCSNGCLEPFNALTAVSLRYQVNPANLANPNYSNSDYDVRHSFNMNFVYTTRKFNNMMANGVLGGWTIASTSLHHSGYPFSVVNTGIRSAQGIGNASGIATEPIVADVAVQGLNYSDCTSPVAPCFSSTQFVSKANQHGFGNVPRNYFRGPGYFDTDLNVNKVFAVREHYRLLVGANFYNLFNHPNFDLPSNNLAVGTFGTIQSTVSAPSSPYGSFQGSAVSGRVVQAQVKFSF